jgi:Sec-independent protein secretion pathway component TatC
MNTPTANKYFLLKVWLLTIFLGAILTTVATLIIEMLDQGSYYAYEVSTGFWGFAIFSILYGLFFSLPLLGICYLVFNWLTRKQLKSVYIILWMDLLGIMGIITTFHFLTPYADYKIYVCYSAALIISSLFSKVYKPVTELR